MSRVAAFIALLVLPALAAAQQDQAVVNRVLGNVPSLVTSVVDPELPAGSIRIEVVDGTDAAVAGQPIRLGVMEQSGKRESKTCMTDEQGGCVFEGLLTDSKHS